MGRERGVRGDVRENRAPFKSIPAILIEALLFCRQTKPGRGGEGSSATSCAFYAGTRALLDSRLAGGLIRGRPMLVAIVEDRRHRRDKGVPGKVKPGGSIGLVCETQRSARKKRRVGSRRAGGRGVGDAIRVFGGVCGMYTTRKDSIRIGYAHLDRCLRVCVGSVHPLVVRKLVRRRRDVDLYVNYNYVVIPLFLAIAAFIMTIKTVCQLISTSLSEL